MDTSSQQKTGLFSQPKAVWAVAFACVISFMGIGLVDPILPAIAAQLHASPSEVSLLFTSYLLVTGFMMFFSGAISSRIGAKWTPLGLIFIIVFAALGEAQVQSLSLSAIAAAGAWECSLYFNRACRHCRGICRRGTKPLFCMRSHSAWGFPSGRLQAESLANDLMARSVLRSVCPHVHSALRDFTHLCRSRRNRRNASMCLMR